MLAGCFRGGVKITTTGLQILFPPPCRDKGTRYLVTGLQFLFVPCSCSCCCCCCCCCCYLSLSLSLCLSLSLSHSLSLSLSLHVLVSRASSPRRTGSFKLGNWSTPWETRSPLGPPVEGLNAEKTQQCYPLEVEERSEVNSARSTPKKGKRMAQLYSRMLFPVFYTVVIYSS